MRRENSSQPGAVRWLLLGAVLSAALPCGCSGMSRADKGLLAGGAIGAGVGNIIGKASGNSTAGTLLGAGVGAVAGGLTGGAMDRAEERRDAAAAVAVRQMQVNDVITMTQQGVSEDVILGHIQQSGSVFHLTAQDTITLSQNRVGDRVIRAMQATATAPPPVVTAVPVYQPVYHRVVVTPPPPPPPPCGFGVSATWRR
jgi:outer membrane lipoprotein SlyB